MHRPATLTLRVTPFRRSAAAAAVVLAASGLGLAACSTQSPAQTNVEYQPADGIAARIGSVEARGLVVVASAKGAPGVLVGSLINTGNDPVTVTFLTADQAQSGATSGAMMQVKGRAQVPVSGVQFAGLPAAPGALTSIVLQTSNAGQTFVDVPVLLPDAYYSTITPTTAPTSATATGVATTANG